ncbi:MAG: TlpA disulfide reductase family protein [Ferruginibacter sp.]
MKNIFAFIFLCLCFLSCKDNKEKGKFILTGNIKNVPDQKVYLEQLYFSDKSPEVTDTGEIKNGKFSVTTNATEESLFRIRLEKNEGGYYFINDAEKIDFNADLNNADLGAPVFNTKANFILKNFLLSLDAQRKLATQSNAKMEELRSVKNNDSALNIEVARQNELRTNYNNYISQFIDTTSDPVVAMFALGYTQGMDPKEIKKIIPGLEKRFPQHQGLKELIVKVNTLFTEEPQKVKPVNSVPGIGSAAPDITMPDINDKPFSLSQLKGKYVLVDFWASWCGPCRGENPNIVAAYKKYKNKNFTILGVSLDENKEAWIKAIKNDNLSWHHISDLKGWNSASVPLYGFDGIPYNVLLDPSGKIIAMGLRDINLHQTLAEVLK